MSCRENAPGAAATTIVGRLLGLPDAQCTSLFHQLRNEYDNLPEGSPENDPSNGTLAGTYFRVLDSLRTEVQRNPGLWTERARAEALARLDRAGDDRGLERRDVYAASRLSALAGEARIAQETFIRNIARNNNMAESWVAGEYDRLRAEYRPSMRAEAVAAGDTSSRLDAPAGSSQVLFPNDPATRRALAILDEGLRCPQCARFTPRGGGHECPGSVAPHERRRSRAGWVDLPGTPEADAARRTRRPRRRAAPAGRRQAAAQPQPVPAASPAPAGAGTGVPGRCDQCGRFRGANGHTCPTPGETFTGEHIDVFQETYDRAKIDIGEGRPVPTDETLESIPGGVTGGLGHPDGGNSFGLELEIDFPNDPYPYEARQQFARRLHEEGIVAYPEVKRWHYLGDEDMRRPGGTYEKSSGDWVCEFDRSVDDVGGDRGVEIKSQILHDTPETWRNLRRVLAVAEELGGKATARTGLHVNVGAQHTPLGDVATLKRLLDTAAAYDDTLVRLGNNPSSGRTHRGRTYCLPVASASTRGRRVRNAVEGYDAHSGHRDAVNIGHITPQYRGSHSDDSRIEFRMFDGVASPDDVGRIQAAVTLNLAMVQGAVDGQEPGQGQQIAGTQRARFGQRRLTGEEWEQSTEPIRNLLTYLDRVAPNSLAREQLVHMFTASRWQSE